MKKILSTTSLLLGFILLTSSTLVAQNDIKIGIGADYGIEVEAIGVEVGAVYGLADQIRGAADVSVYFPDSPEGV
jgi:hypothetical protein